MSEPISRELLEEIGSITRRAKAWDKRLEEIEEKATSISGISYTGEAHAEDPHTSGSGLEAKALKMMEEKEKALQEMREDIRALLRGYQTVRRWFDIIPSSKDKEIVEYRCFDGLSWREVAQTMELSEWAVRKRYSRFLRQHHVR